MSTLFEGSRRTMPQAIDLTIQSIEAYGSRYDHWAIAYSGGKDSSLLVTLVAHLIKAGRIDPPKRLTVCYADTRMELPPLAGAAQLVLVAGPDRYPGGKFVEAGIAMGLGKPVVVLGHRENMLLWHPDVHAVETIDRLVEYLGDDR